MGLLKYIPDWTIPVVTTPTTAVRSKIIEKKHVIVEANRDNTDRIHLAVIVEPGETAPAYSVDYDIFNPGEIKFYGAPANKQIRHFYAYVQGGSTQKLNLIGSDGALTFGVSGKYPEGGRVITHEDETLNDADKEITVPSGKLWKILNVYVDYTSDATVGDRNVECRLLNILDEEIFASRNADNIGPSEHYRLIWTPGISKSETQVGLIAMQPFPQDVPLPTGFSVQVVDINSVALAGDDMLIRLLIREWSV